ncbi:MAG: UDP-N-acetylmuramoyl-tripeptide--D-alanyl-D-alanine ligase [Lachnospiraceae bacterium]|nr:UDP-N-acetylmuramoyl-tripeptide--D-alanyl-D-alanine ligase [Lachnospiraceae bacterium]
MKHLTVQNIAAACGGTVYGPAEGVRSKTEATAVVIDSREAKKDDVFIAMPGERVDGHKFIGDVWAKGALAVVCEVLPKSLDGVCIQVESSARALRDIAEFYRKQLTLTVVGVTGSVGKTSTKEMIAGVLSEKYNTLKTSGNYNNEIGLPLTILRIREEHQAAVVEMGISEFGEMHRLSKVARPDICVITNIGQCHLESLGDRDGVLKAKTEIFDFRNPEGVVCVNGDDDKLVTLRGKLGDCLTTFGRERHNTVYARRSESKGLLGSCMDIAGLVELTEVTVPLPGEHMIYNALAAAAVGYHMGLTREQIRAGIEKARAVGGRSNLLQKGDYVLIDDCYNANPVSMKAALELLGQAEGRKVAVLGDMFELGEGSPAFHKETGNYAVKCGVDVLFCVGTLSEAMYEGGKEALKDVTAEYRTELIYLKEKEELKNRLPEVLQPGDTILLKASHGMGFEEVIEWI